MIERISVNPKIHFGKPCITGTRIRVDHVLELLDEGLTFYIFECCLQQKMRCTRNWDEC
jgi:hypothetical protein